MTAHRILKSVASVTLLFALSACLPQTTQWDNNAVTMRNTVELVRLPHSVQFAGDMTNLSAGEAQRLGSFLEGLDPTTADRIFLDVARDSNGVPTARGRNIANAVRQHLVKAGYDVVETPIAWGATPGANEVRVVLERHVVIPPHCPNWSQPAWPNYANAPTSNMGCANQTALGLMVANPRDLVEGQKYEANNTESSDRAIRAMRDGKTKWVAKTGQTMSISAD